MGQACQSEDRKPVTSGKVTTTGRSGNRHPILSILVILFNIMVPTFADLRPGAAT